jgi:hypothetical protein
MPGAEPRKPFWAKCGSCSHCWPAAYAPMEVMAFARTVKAARCPMCGGKKILVAKQDDGKLQESEAT